MFESLPVSAGLALALIAGLLAAFFARRARAAETALAEARAHFERSFRLLPELLTLSRLDDARLVDVNDNWVTVLGCSRQESLGRSSVDLGLWQQPAELAEIHAELLAGKEIADRPVRLRTRGGEPLETRLRAHLLRSGKQAYVLAAFRDVTAQLRLEHAQQAAAEAQRVSEAMFSAAFHSSPDCIIISRLADGKILEVNRAFMQLTGWSRDAAIGASALSLGLWPFPEERAAMVELISDATALRDFPCTFGTAQGEGRDCLFNASPVSIAGQTCLISIVRDITEQKRAADRLQESQAKFATIFNSAPCALALTRIADRVYLDANPAWEKLFGLGREVVVSRTTGELGFWVDPETYDAIYASLATGDVLQQQEVRLRVPGRNEIATCLISARRLPINHEDCALWSLVDITELRRIQAHIEELNQSLEARVTERTAELTAALETLRHTQEELVRSEKLAALGSLVAGIAHELNTPIGNSVTIATTLAASTEELAREHAAGALRRSSFDHFTHNARSATDLLMRSLLRAEELVRSFKQVAVDQTSEQRRRFDLGEVLHEMAITLSPMLKNTPYTLELASTESISMDSYPGPLGQVLTNLVSNALQHAFDGLEHGHIVVTTRPVGNDKVEIEFADDGVGIPHANLRRIFDPFFTTRLGRGGSGLGLHIIYNLVTCVLGGNITVFSTPGTGCRFVLTLPLTAPASPGDGQAPGTDPNLDVRLNFEHEGPII